MMGEWTEMQEALFYEFSLEDGNERRSRCCLCVSSLS